MIDPAVGYSIVLGMAVLLSTSGLQKIRDFSLFSALLSAYRIVPGKLLRVVAMVVPCVEMLLAVGLCVAPCRRGCLAAAATLLICYGMAMGVNLAAVAINSIADAARCGTDVPSAAGCCGAMACLPR
jgi:hypothetical protein